MIPHHRRMFHRRLHTTPPNEEAQPAQNAETAGLSNAPDQDMVDDVLASEARGSGSRLQGGTPNYADPASKVLTSSQGGRYRPPDYTNYNPATLQDIDIVASFLNASLPMELVLEILDTAEYWVQESVYRNTQMSAAEGNSPATYICTSPIQGRKLSAEQQGGAVFNGKEKDIYIPSHGPVKKIVFEIRSHDQGRSDYSEFHGTYSHSWTWFTASVTPFPVRTRSASQTHHYPTPQRSSEPTSRRHLQTNIHASKRDTTHTITWTADAKDAEEKEWVRGLRVGDVVNVEAWARFPEWVNHVAGVSVGVFVGGI